MVFDATFGICSKVYIIKNKKWKLLKLSFGHIEDDIGLCPSGIILANAVESHDVLLEYMANFMVYNIRKCTNESDYKYLIGTDNSTRDVNIGEIIIQLITDKLNLSPSNPIYLNENGIPFDVRKITITVNIISLDICLYFVIYYYISFHI